jgi:hypothetical protein
VRREQIRNNEQLMSFLGSQLILTRETELYLVSSEAQDWGRDKEIEDLEIEAANAESFQSIQVHLKVFDSVI